MEIERKFLLSDNSSDNTDDTWKNHIVKSIKIHQGYIYSSKNKVVRVRTYGDHAYLTIKAPQKNTNFTFYEYEYEIPLLEAEEMLSHIAQKPTISKIRHFLMHDNTEWTIDEFTGKNQGLILAEVELQTETQAITLPSWAHNEVTGDPKYFNSNL